MGNELAVITQDFGALSPKGMRALQTAAAQFEGERPSFDRIKIPSGGGIAFEVPGDDPASPDIKKELIGVVVDHYPANGHWETEYNGEKNPPVCASLDGKWGTNTQTGERIACKTCPLNAFGTDSKTGRGKACKNMWRLFLLQPDGGVFPIMVTLPPTSRRAWIDFAQKRIFGKGRELYETMVKITLAKEKNKDGVEYAKAQFAIMGALSEEAAQRMQEYSAAVMGMTREVEITDDDYNTEGSGGAGQDINAVEHEAEPEPSERF